MLLKRELSFKSEDEMYTFFVKILLLLYEIKLQPKVVDIFRYFVQYGVSPAVHEKILADGVVPKEQSISNAKTELASVGLLIKHPKWKLAPGLEKVDLSKTLEVLIKCQNQTK